MQPIILSSEAGESGTWVEEAVEIWELSDYAPRACLDGVRETLRQQTCNEAFAGRILASKAGGSIV